MSVETKEAAPAPARTLGNGDLRAMFLRSLLIQAGWNYERSQNIGFAFCMLPALRRIYAAPEALRAALARHLELFNTQPYMAGFVLGNLARMEEALALKPGDAALEKNARDIKQALATSFAAIGDRVFWGRLKPLTSQVCIAVWLLGGFYGWLFTGSAAAVPPGVLFAGPLAGMAVYGAFALHLRWYGLEKGYACGGAASCGLDMLDWHRLIRRLSLAGFALSLGIAIAALSLLVALNLRGMPSGPSGPGPVVAGMWLRHPSVLDLALKAGLVLSVLGLHRLARRLGRSVFFAVGVILAVSVLFFGVLRTGSFGLL